MEIYERIKARRKELGLSADDVALALGVSRATVYRYECADIEKLPTQIIIPLAAVLKCSPGWLMGWDDSKDESPRSDSTEQLLTGYRHLDKEGQSIIDDLIVALDSKEQQTDRLLAVTQRLLEVIRPQ